MYDNKLIKLVVSLKKYEVKEYTQNIDIGFFKRIKEWLSKTDKMFLSRHIKKYNIYINLDETISFFK